MNKKESWWLTSVAASDALAVAARLAELAVVDNVRWRDRGSERACHESNDGNEGSGEAHGKRVRVGEEDNEAG